MTNPAAGVVLSPLPVLRREPGTNAESQAVPDATISSCNTDQEGGNQDAASIKTATTDLFLDHVVAAPTANNPRQHRLGLDINEPWGWDGSSYNDYDVVTVHGIRDDYRTAWTDAQGVWWVKDKLFKSLSTRQVDYSYEIDAASMLYEPGGIMQHAQRLVTEYAAVRQKLEETETDRPIIWICHDLGGTIVKEALCLALHNPATYGKIAVLTTAIVFLGTPHRCESRGDLEDELHRLVLLPGSGPHFVDGVLHKIKELSRQVIRANQRFLATKLLDRAAILNVFAQTSLNNQNQDPVDEHITEVAAPSPDNRHQYSNVDDPVTPFPPSAHRVGHSFEAAGAFSRENVAHLTLVHGEFGGGESLRWLSRVFNFWEGFPIKVQYDLLQFQAWLLSLAPPTRALDTPFGPALPKPHVITWIHEQQPYISFSRLGVGPRILHLHANGNALLDIASVSRLFYLDYDSSRTQNSSGFAPVHIPRKSVIYFEFAQHDSRYNTISSLLLYLINALACHCWERMEIAMIVELDFLSHNHAWSLEDLFHVFSTFRRWGNINKTLTIFISCFDQCPADQRQWFLERVLQEQGYSDCEYRLVLSTSAREDLTVPSFPDEARINLDDSPTLSGVRTIHTEGLKSHLNALIAMRPVYGIFRSQLGGLMEECEDLPHFGNIILTWLGHNHRGKPRSFIANTIRRLSPPTAENLARVFISSVSPLHLRTRVETVFNWVKHAAEPWSPESLAEALVVRELSEGEEPSFEDLDVGRTMKEIEEVLGGILTSEMDGDVKFSHPSFYHAPEVGFEERGPEAIAKANSTIAETCLRYFHFGCAQETLAAFSRENMSPEGIPSSNPLDSTIISCPRTSMGAYAVRFWHQHYNASGRFKPRELVEHLFASREARAAWEVSFWLLSNPFTRLQRSYVSTLPVFAMLGLEDLVQEKTKIERHRPTFNKDCWLAITEAARAGRRAMVQRLLELTVAVDEEELRAGLHWAAGRGDAPLVNILLDKIPNPNTFHWPDNMIHQATAAGLTDLLVTMLRSGCNINEVCECYWRAPPVGIAAFRQRVPTMEVLVHWEDKPDLNMSMGGGAMGNNPLFAAAEAGSPLILGLLLKAGADVEFRNQMNEGAVHRAAQRGNHKAIEVLIKAGADFKSCNGKVYFARRPLINAADSGSEECVRVLLAHGADPNADSNGKTALYQAVQENHLGIVRLLLAHDPKPDMERIPLPLPELPGEVKALIRAVYTANTKLVSLLIDHGAEVNFIDPNQPGFCKTPLSQACAEGYLEVVKLLLAKGASINYTGDGDEVESHSPLLAALYYRRVEVARYLLQHDTLDVKRLESDGTSTVHAACYSPSIIAELLQKGAPVDSYSASFGTVLHRAVQMNEPKALELLLAHDPPPEIDKHGNHEHEFGFTPLQLACKYRFPECVKILLEGGANPTLKNEDGDDALDILLRTNSAAKGVAECLRLLISVSYSIPGDQVDEHGRGRLHAIQETTPVSIVQGLVEAKAPIDIQDEEGHTPLSVAVSKDNEMVARYLVSQGASVNRFSPLFGSILHLAVRRGNLDMARFLVDSGADLDTVDPAYGESLLYTALGIEDQTKLKAMVRYLVDDARAPINKPGGAQFSYPIIRAAHLAISSPSTGTGILKFLIRRNAQLEVSDSQGRRAVHIACASSGSDTIKALIAAGANIDVKDALGRMPIHFAASQPYGACFDHLLETFKETEINTADSDKWTPLMWAARSGAISTLNGLVERNADVWTRGYGSDGSVAWSALKLLNFSGRGSGQDLPRLEPEERTRVGPDGRTEEWDEDFHKTQTGDLKDVVCNSCCVIIRGIQWECGVCNDGFSLCFKCYGHRTTVHHPEHEFNSLGRLYEQPMTTSGSPWDNNSGDAGGNEGFLGGSFGDLETEHVHGGGDEASLSHGGSDDGTLWFDIDGSPEGSEED